MRPSFVVAALLVAAIIIAVLQWQADTDDASETVEQLDAPAVPAQGETAPVPQPEPQNAPPVEPILPKPAAEPPPALEPAVTLPELAASDAFVRAEIEPWQLPDAWLKRSDLLSRASVVLMNAAAGKIPTRQVSFLVPSEAYPVIKSGDRYFVDPNGYGRYDPYIAILESIEPADLAGFLRLVDPLLVQALAQLGVREPPSELLAQAIARVERVSNISDGSIELLRPSVMYTYADPALEALPDLDKQLLRIGPQNVSRLQAYLIEFKEIYFLE